MTSIESLRRGAAGATPPAPTAPPRNRALAAGLAVIQLGPVLVLGVIAVLFSAVSPLFLTGDNLLAIGVQSAPIAVLALGQLLVVLTRGIDLSVGSCMALSMIVGWEAWHADAPAALVILVILLCGASVGLVNGLVYVKGRIPHPFIVTLGMLNVAAGAALVISNGEPKVGMPDAIVTLGSGKLAGVPNPIVLVAVLSLVVLLLTRRVAWGRWIYAAGGNPEGAVRAGIPLGRVLISVYVFSGLSAGVAALLVAGRTASAFPTAGYQAELDAIAAVIIGGASFFGGRGGVVSAIVGALIIGSIRNGLNLAQVSPNWQQVAVGVVVVGAVALDVLRTRLEIRARQRQARAAEATA